MSGLTIEVGKLVPCTFSESSRTGFHIWTKQVILIALNNETAIVEIDGRRQSVYRNQLRAFSDVMDELAAPA